MKAFELSVVVGVLLFSTSVLAKGKTDPKWLEEGSPCQTDSECGKLQFCDKSIVVCPDVVYLDCNEPTDPECNGEVKRAQEKEGDCVPGPTNECRNFPENSCLSVSDCNGAAYECHYLESCACWGATGPDDWNEEECVCEPDEYGTCLLQLQTCETASDCMGEFEGYECADTLVSRHCFLMPSWYDGHNQEEDDDTALCLGGLQLGFSVCAPESAVKSPGNGNGQPTANDVKEKRGLGAGLDKTPPNYSIGGATHESLLNDPILSYENPNPKSTNAPVGAAGGCHIGNTASAAYLPVLLGLMLLVVRRRFAHSA